MIEKISGQIELSSKELKELEKKSDSILELKKYINDNLNSSTSILTKIILSGAINLRVSDIHLEPEENNVRIRFRIDGDLQDVMLIPKAIYTSLLSRIKLLSKMKLNIFERPQDGRFSIVILEHEENDIEVRTSILPTEYGESLVIRILNPKDLINLEDLGLRPDLLDLFREEIKKPNGMILVTGPTGSGKTTTLYSFLKKIQKPDIKIITIEDPIEYRLEGITQTQVDAERGYNFANGLRSIVRQDPDVILVGEIRDPDTAKIAVQAALTGHLVLSTLHTNDAAGTIARLVSLGAKTSNIGPAVNIVIAQRLVRKVCPKCSKLRKISGEEMKKIKKDLENLPPQIKIPKINKETLISQTVGCKYCNFTGYRGRVGIFEAIPIDEEMEKFITKQSSIAEIRDLAIKKGMVTMHQDGFIKVLEKITTIEEVERITGQQNAR